MKLFKLTLLISLGLIACQIGQSQDAKDIIRKADEKMQGEQARVR